MQVANVCREEETMLKSEAGLCFIFSNTVLTVLSYVWSLSLTLLVWLGRNTNAQELTWLFMLLCILHKILWKLARMQESSKHMGSDVCVVSLA